MIKLKCKLTLFLLLTLTSCGNMTTVSPSAIPVQSVTPQTAPILTSTSTPPKITASTPSPQPTLTKEQVQEAITEFMTGNESCSKPCFWGFSPESGLTADEILQFFSFLSEKPRINSETGEFQQVFSINYKKRVNISATFSYADSEGALKSIEVDMHGLSYSPEITNTDWEAFRPDTILKVYGKPSSVEFFLSHPTEPTADQTVGYDYRFYYEREKFVIAYTGQRTLNQPQLRVCPLEDSGISSIYLYLGDDLQINPARGKTLSEISSLSIDDFYSTMTEDKSGACFNINRDAFEQ